LSHPPGALQQGDVLLGVSVPLIDQSNEEWVLTRVVTDVIVLTQSCDIEKSAQKQLLVATVYPFRQVLARFTQLREDGYRQNLLRQQSIPDFLIPPLIGIREDWSYVSFRQLHVISKVQAEQCERLELLSPYREGLAQAYARFMMRVGLPEGIQDCAMELPS
jgi:hypothetical protein